MIDEEEKKKRMERAKQIAHSINQNNYSSNFNNIALNRIKANTEQEKAYIDKFQKAREITNSINPRENVLPTTVSEEDKIKSQQNAQKFLDLIDNNVEEKQTSTQNLEENLGTIPKIEDTTRIKSSSQERKNQIKNKEELDKQIAEANSQNVTTQTKQENSIIDKDIKIGLANQTKTQNTKELSTTDIKIMKEANKKNKNLEQDGIEKFNEWADTVLNNVFGGVKQAVSGFANVVTTLAGLGVKGLSGASKIVGLNDISNSLDETYNKIIDTGSSINETANIEKNINSQVNNDFIKTSGEISNVISNMLGNAVIGYATGINGSVAQGLSVGGNSAQEVLDENKDNIGQATLTGIAKGYTSYLTEKMFDANILTKGSKKTSIQQGINKLISKNIDSKLGKEIANRTVGIIGENLEELAEDNAGYFIDKLINNKDLPSFEQWWNSTTETAKITTLSTMIMGLLGLGGSDFKDIEMDMETEYWVNQAQQIIEQEDLAIHFNPSEVKTIDTMQDFYISKFTEDGELINILPTKGKEINNYKPELNVVPVVVKDNQTNYYTVIDGNTGVVLDSTPYSTTIEAEGGFNEKANKLTDLQIKDINNKITKADYVIKNNIISMIQEAQSQLNQKTTVNYNFENAMNSKEITNNVSQNFSEPTISNFYNNETNYAVPDIKKVTEPFNAQQEYSKEEIQNIWYDKIIDNEYDTIYDNRFDIESYITLEEDGNDLVVNQYDNEDNLIKSEVIPDDNGKYNAEAIKNTIEKVSRVYDENKPIKGQVDIGGNEVIDTEITKYKNVSRDLINNIDSILNETIDRNRNIKVLDNTPLLFQKVGMNNLPVIMTQDHIRSTILTLQEAIEKKLNVKNKNFHGLGKETLLKVIDNIDKPIAIYQWQESSKNKYGKDDYIIITQFKDKNNDRIIVPVLANRKDNIFLTVNKIKSTYGKVGLDRYLKKNIEEGNLRQIYTKKELDNSSGGIQYSSERKSNSNINSSIPQKTKSVKNDTTTNNKSMQKTKNDTNIQDFGEKIGGARKDLAQPKSVIKTTKEVAHDYTVTNTDNGYSVNFKKKILKDGFKTQKEAEQYILDFKENIKSNIAYVEEGSNLKDEERYAIKLRNPRTLKSEYTGKVFNNRLDAESYAIALSIYLKEHGKNLFRPEIQKVERINPNIKNATKTTGNDILNNFGFKGGEFGNWVNQTERQEFLNYAQNAFTDLAIALDIDASSLGQNNEMNIAFGARGKGLTGAVAHFEPEKRVINMTRLKGAGSLAHEYGHSIDNYLSRLSGYNDEGMATTNLRNPKLSDNIKKAINNVVDFIKYNISTNQEEINKKNAIYEKNRISSLDYHLQYIDKVFDGRATTYKYNRKTKSYENIPIQVTEEQKRQYKKIRKTLEDGKVTGDYKIEIKSQSSFSTVKVYPEPVSTLQDLYKKVVGSKLNDDTVYGIYRNGKPTKQVTEVKSESAFMKSARELDKATGRATPYFSKTEEMWARAFESYISDKLKENGITNTYLVHSVNNSEYALFNPFPAGEERTNINTAFDNLIQVMKEEGLFKGKTIEKLNNNDGIRYMKTKNNKSTKSEKTTDNQGRILSKEQQEYFKDSKVRDGNGNLLTVYHGTEANVGIPKEYWFNIFDEEKQGNNGSWFGNGFYFTKNKEHAQDYAHSKGNIYESYLNITNPYIPYKNGNSMLSFQEDFRNNFKETEKIEGKLTGKQIQDILKNNSYDGIVIGDNIIAFYSNQIKNVDNTKPTTNPDIRFTKKQNKVIHNTQRNAERAESYIEKEIKKIEATGNWDNNIPVTKMSDIRKTIENYLGLGIKKGQFRQQAYAIYKGNRDVIRTKELKDMDSILHETGHALDLGNRLNIDKESIADELLTAIDKLGGYEGETRTIRLEEGFAEVIREYTIIPEQAKIEYPQTVAVIQKIRQNDKSFDNFISKVQQQTYNYIHQNPRNRALSNMSIGEKTDKQPLTIDWVKQEVMRNVYDSDYVIKSIQNELAKKKGKTTNSVKASNNIYLLTRLANASHSKAISMLSEGYINLNGNKTMPGLNKIGEILGNNPERYNDLRAYLVAQRDLEYKSKTLKTGIRTMDSKTIVEQFKNDTQILEAAKVIYDTLDGVLQYAVDNHLIDTAMAEKLRESNAFYVPMQRVLENDKGNKIGHRGAVADIMKKRTGSELDIKDVLENIVTNSANIIQQVDNNNALKALYNQGEEVGITGTVYDVISTPMVKIGTANLAMWEKELKNQGVNTNNLDLEKTIDIFVPDKKIDTKNLITSFIDDNGKRIYLQFNDELTFNAVTGMDKQFMSSVLKINAKMNMPLRYGATMANLGFAIPNMISDTAQATIFSTAGFIPIIDNVIGVLDVLTANNKSVKNFMNKVAPDYVKKVNLMYSLYNQSGATSSTRMSQYRKSAQEMMENVYGTKSSNLGIEDKFKPLKRLLDLLTYIPEISEQSTRLRVFEKNYDYYKNKGTSEMDTRIMAAIEARDATQDFSRTGNLTREINQLIPFSAARVGSAYTFAEKIKANPKQVSMRIAILTALAMTIKAIGYDDEEIQELNQRKKDDNFVLKIGDSIVTIKKPQGILRSIINLAEYIQDLATGNIEEGKEGERLGKWLNNAIMDNMPADQITGLVPNMVAPLIENAINKDFYYNTDIVKSYDLELPDSEQYYDYNSQLAICLGKVFNYSPAKIDNLISGYFAGLGTTVTDIMDYALGKTGITAEQPEMGVEDNAVGKRFFVNVNSNSSSVDEIYDRKTELTKLKNGGTITAEETKELETITDAISNLSNLNKQIKEIKKDLSMSGKEKAEKIKLLQQEKTDTARKALGKEVIYPENESKIQSTQFYPNDTLKKSGYTLTLSSEQKKEYEQFANSYYSKYEQQGLYSKEKLEDIKSKAKEYAKNEMFKKYKSDLVKTKK